MPNTKEICTTYRVLDVREPVSGDNFTPFVIIAEKSETKERRRIEILSRGSNKYQNAQKLIAGDTFSVLEWVFDNGNRLMKDLIVYFNEEELTVDEL